MTKFSMIRIAVEQFAILSQTLPDDKITYSVGLGFKYAASKRRVICVLDIKFQTESEVFLVLKVACEFEVDSVSWATFIKESSLIIPRDLLEHLAVHTVGVARGILFCKTDGTPFSAIILPPVNVREMVTEDIVATPAQEPIS